jgi:hypothetical protein
MPQLRKHGLAKRGSGAKFKEKLIIAAITQGTPNAMTQTLEILRNVPRRWKCGTSHIKMIHMDQTHVLSKIVLRSTMTTQAVLRQFSDLPFTCGSAAARALGLASAGCQT